MNDIKNTKGLIIDLRCYPSATLTYSLTEYLLPQTQPFAKFTNASLINPGNFIWTEPFFVGINRNDYYKGKVVVLINEWTQSASEFFVMALQTVPGVTIIGSRTAGADGNISEIYLSGQVLTYMSGIGVYYPDGRETQRIGIIPDIEVRPTVRGIQESRDEVLEKALEIIHNTN